MDDTEHEQFADIALVNAINSLNIHPKVLRTALSHRHPNLYRELVSRTSFLDNSHTDTKEVSVFSRIYCLEHGLHGIPLCSRSGCPNHVHWNNDNRTFHKYCSLRCRSSDKAWQDQVKEVSNNRHGGVGFASEELRRKSRDTMLATRGVDHQMHDASVLEKVKRTNKETYGHEWAIASEPVKQKIRSACCDKFGVDNYAKTAEYHKRAHRRYTNAKYPDMSFGSSWEFKVYDFLTEHDIPFEYQVEPIDYEYDGSIHKYFPDFKVNGRIYEVKGDNFFRTNESTGKEEMFCPYRYPEWSDEKYEWMCGLYEAKHQCMLSHDVVVLREIDVSNLEKTMFDGTITSHRTSDHIQQRDC